MGVSMDSRQRFLRGFLWMSLGMALFFTAEFALEWHGAGHPGAELLSWTGNNNAKLVDLMSPMARAYNNVLAMLIATIGLAIPLTANMHTPKLIDMFLRDRTNQIMLGACAIGAAHVLWAAWMVGPGFAPTWAIRLSVFGTLLGWAALIPYFFYVVRFLDPSNILRRLRTDVVEAIDQVQRGKLDPEEAQNIIHERMHQTGTIVIKSIDRADRSVALEGIWGLKLILQDYGERKALMPAAWFKVDRRDFVGASQEALQVINEERNWFELRVMTQFFLAYQGALARSTDAIPAISDATRVVAALAVRRGDREAYVVATRFFHNYLREAIKRKDVHALFDLFYQYRTLASDLLDRPEELHALGQRFRYYAEQATAQGLTFAQQLAGYDLGWVALEAAAAASPSAPLVLSEMIALNHNGTHGPRMLLIKAKIVVGAGLIERKRGDLAQLVADNLADLPADLLAQAVAELAAVHERAFWEVTDRQVNVEWMAPEHRACLGPFSGLLGLG